MIIRTKHDGVDWGYSEDWWRETKAMVNRGYRLFCRRHGIPEDPSEIYRPRKHKKTKP